MHRKYFKRKVNSLHVTGCLCIAIGCLISLLDLLFPHKFSTILEVDYDTPYDRHIIIEESHDKRKKGKRSLEEPEMGIGRKILRFVTSSKVEYFSVSDFSCHRSDHVHK